MSDFARDLAGKSTHVCVYARLVLAHWRLWLGRWLRFWLPRCWLVGWWAVGLSDGAGNGTAGTKGGNKAVDESVDHLCVWESEE